MSVLRFPPLGANVAKDALLADVLRDGQKCNKSIRMEDGSEATIVARCRGYAVARLADGGLDLVWKFPLRRRRA